MLRCLVLIPIGQSASTLLSIFTRTNRGDRWLLRLHFLFGKDECSTWMCASGSHVCHDSLILSTTFAIRGFN